MLHKARKLLSIALLSTAATVVSVSAASAAAIITNGTVTLGVDDYGQLNIPGPPSSQGTTDVGLRHNASNNEATGAGCDCEGWGAGDAALGISGWANNDEGGPNGLALVSFASGADTATSVSRVANLLEVTHHFRPSASSDLFEVVVTLKNISGAALTDLRYRRLMDWDVEPTAFDEFVTIQGTAGASAVLKATDDGFESADPLSPNTGIIAEGDFVDSGPDDHGAAFDFGFGGLDVDGEFTFSIFYGASDTEAEAIAALALVEAEVYSFGQTSRDPRGLRDPTFIFAFKGVGGDPVEPVSEPASLAILGFGLAGLALARRRR